MVTAGEKLLVVLCAVFVLYQLFTVSVVLCSLRGTA